ncbi:hypothetical protein QE449_000947 [Rhodococcus sp. SORGH_AS303]|nr:hypothetical protein [Rhodococcus sp. SORGH_AS_0303]
MQYLAQRTGAGAVPPTVGGGSVQGRADGGAELLDQRLAHGRDERFLVLEAVVDDAERDLRVFGDGAHGDGGDPRLRCHGEPGLDQLRTPEIGGEAHGHGRSLGG